MSNIERACEELRETLLEIREGPYATGLRKELETVKAERDVLKKQIQELEISGKHLASYVSASDPGDYGDSLLAAWLRARALDEPSYHRQWATTP
jgi:hypothetical protein